MSYLEKYLVLNAMEHVAFYQFKSISAVLLKESSGKSLLTSNLYHVARTGLSILMDDKHC